MSGDDTATAALTLEPTDVSGAKAHDFVAIYRAWFRPVYRWIRALGGPGIEAEDLTQEVFIVVQRKLGGFDGAHLAGWLYRIAQLTVRDHRRRAWVRNLFRRVGDVALDDVATPADALDDRMVRKQQQVRLYQLVEQINPRWREVFLLFEVGGQSGEQIAALLGIPPATVRVHLFRARKALTALVARERAGGMR